MSGPPSTLHMSVMSFLTSEFATLKPSYVLSWPPASPTYGQSMGSAPPGFEHASRPRRHAMERRLSPSQWMLSVVTEETVVSVLSLPEPSSTVVVPIPNTPSRTA